MSDNGHKAIGHLINPGSLEGGGTALGQSESNYTSRGG